MNETMTKAAPELGGQKASEQSVLDLLLGTAENVEEHLPTGRYEVPRLSKRAGKPVVFTLQALPYGRVQDLRRFQQDVEIQILLEGCVDPPLRDERLVQRFHGATPGEALKRLLLPGEIADLSAAVERLTGYRRATILEKVKND